MPFDPSYGEAPPNTAPMVFAQLCTEVTAIEIEKALVINLYDNSDNITPLDMSGDQFMSYFYPDGRSFSLNCDISGRRAVVTPMKQTKNGFGGGDFMRLDAWVRAEEMLSNSGEGSAGLAQDLSGVQFELAPEVISRWAQDLGVTADCWTPCSLMRIVSELLKANYVCNLACDVCCSLCTFELAQALNSRGNEGIAKGAQYDGRNAQKPVKENDVVALSLLFTNPNSGARAVDVRLNFKISENVSGAS